MKLVPAISKGKAILLGDELRCNRLREDSSKICRKLIAKVNRFGQIAGDFRCERCKEEIEVRLVPATEESASKTVKQRFEKPTNFTPREVSE